MGNQFNVIKISRKLVAQTGRKNEENSGFNHVVKRFVKELET